MIDPKDLKKLAAACRAAGIASFKSGDVEFTLSDSKPTARKSKPTTTKEVPKDAGLDLDPASDGWDSLSPEERLLWSTGSPQ